jgi:hypothetical protein
MITKDELLAGRDKQYPKEYTAEVSGNLDRLLVVLNKVRQAYGKPMYVNSGWRPAAVNDATSNAAKKSTHIRGLACDFRDPDGKLWQWCIANLALLQKLGVYLEDKRWTPSWVHCQIVPPASGKRIYVPSTAPATAPDVWDGTYDHKYDKVV